jgi:hypothetical protein
MIHQKMPMPKATPRAAVFWGGRGLSAAMLARVGSGVHRNGGKIPAPAWRGKAGSPAAGRERWLQLLRVGRVYAGEPLLGGGGANILSAEKEGAWQYR